MLACARQKVESQPAHHHQRCGGGPVSDPTRPPFLPLLLLRSSAGRGSGGCQRRLLDLTDVRSPRRFGWRAVLASQLLRQRRDLRRRLELELFRQQRHPAAIKTDGARAIPRITQRPEERFHRPLVRREQPDRRTRTSLGLHGVTALQLFPGQRPRCGRRPGPQPLPFAIGPPAEPVGVRQVEAVEEGSLIQLQRLLPPPGVHGILEPDGIAAHGGRVDGEAIPASRLERIGTEGSTEGVQCLAQGVAGGGFVAFRPEEGEQLVALVHSVGPRDGQIHQDGHSLGLQQHRVQLDSVRAAQVEGPERSEFQHLRTPRTDRPGAGTRAGRLPAFQ